MALFRPCRALGAACVLFAAAIPLAAGPISYQVSVDTSSVSGNSGFLNFEFDPGDLSSQLATATMSNFTGIALQLSNPGNAVTGDITGTLPGTVTFVNDQDFNDYFVGATYSSGFSFLLTLSGPAIDTPNGTSTAGSTFFISLTDDTGDINILPPSGPAGQVDINLDGTTTPTAFPSDADRDPSVVSFSLQAVPEPGSLTLLMGGILAAAGWRLRRGRRSS
jgi:hypothetical protein